MPPVARRVSTSPVHRWMRSSNTPGRAEPIVEKFNAYSDDVRGIRLECVPGA